MEEILLLLQNIPFEYGQPIESEVLEKLERRMQVRLPKSYKQFLLKFGYLEFGPDEIIGIDMQNPNYEGFDEVRESLLKNDPVFANKHSLIPVYNNGGGDYTCLDVSTFRDDCECGVVGVWHGDGPDQKPELVATSFKNWLAMKIQSRL